MRAWNGCDRLREYRPNRQVLRQRRAQPEQRKDRNLSRHRHAESDSVERAPEKAPGTKTKVLRAD